MTPEQHLDKAEQYLMVATGYDQGKGGPWITNNLLAALAHALIAHVAEAGVPHSAELSGGGEPGAHPLDPQL